MTLIPRSFHLRREPEDWQDFYTLCESKNLTGNRVLDMVITALLDGDLVLTPAGISTPPRSRRHTATAAGTDRRTTRARSHGENTSGQGITAADPAEGQPLT